MLRFLGRILKQFYKKFFCLKWVLRRPLIIGNSDPSQSPLSTGKVFVGKEGIRTSQAVHREAETTPGSTLPAKVVVLYMSLRMWCPIIFLNHQACTGDAQKPSWITLELSLEALWCQNQTRLKHMKGTHPKFMIFFPCLHKVFYLTLRPF